MPPSRPKIRRAAMACAAVFSVSLIAPFPLAVKDAAAQERSSRSPSILEFFGFKRAKPEKPAKSVKRPVKRVAAKPQRRKTPSVKQTARRSVRGAGAETAAAVQGLRLDTAEPVLAPVAKLDNAKQVLVIGDFMAGAVAEGLIEAFVTSANVKITEKWNGSSGFVRSDYYDWPASLPAIAAEIKPSAIVVMLGTNDRQQMLAGGERLTLGTPAWTQEYEERVSAFAQALKASGVPAVWVGQPALRSSQMTASMLAFNDIYRRNVEAAGGVFVDIWDGFVDETGAFQQSGPDMNGQPARLRGSDGISFAKAGKRKAAFYAEKPLRQILNEPVAPILASLPKGGASPEFIGPLLPAPVVIIRTDPISLNDPALDGGSELLGAAPAPARPGANKSPRDLLVQDGIAPRAKPGRVDDFSSAAPGSAGLDDAAQSADGDRTGATR